MCFTDFFKTIDSFKWSLQKVLKLEPTGLRVYHYVIHQCFPWKAVVALYLILLLQSPAPCNLPTAERTVS